jgi:5'-3' exonuclease
MSEINEPLILVDASNVVWQALHSVRGELKKNKTLWAQLPKPVKMSQLSITRNSVIAFFLDELFTTINSYSDGHKVLIALDSKPSWRYKVAPDYKGHRKEIKDRFAEDIDIEDVMGVFSDMYELLKQCPYFIVVAAPTAEADDVIGTVVLNNDSKNNFIMSSDRDFMQLGHKARLVSRYKEDGCSKLVSELEAAVMRERKILSGDSGDHIKAVVPKVTGPKFAENAVTVENVTTYANGLLTELCKVHPFARDSFIRNKILIDLSKSPPAIKATILLEYNLQRSKWRRDLSPLVKFLREQNLIGLGPKVQRVINNHL